MREETATRGSRLGDAINKRLAQLGMSRRELARRIQISRQTLHLLEHESERNFAEATFIELDKGLKWKSGTARAIHAGHELDTEDMNERVLQYLRTILTHLETMNIEQLEREVLMLEDEAFGKDETGGHPSTERIAEVVQRLMKALADE